MKKTALLLVLVAVLVSMVLFPGCRTEQQLPTPKIPILNNELANGKLVIESPVAGEGFTFVREYSTSYNAKNWRITDSKSLKMRAWVKGAKGTILVEHMHADVSLKSRYESFDGWLQDSMDDSIHGGTQPGFYVTEQYPYENVFAVEGFSKTLIDGWVFLIGSYGAGGIYEQRLTETNLVRYGKVYGNKVQIVYDLLIKAENEPYFHTRSLIDEFLVPTAIQPSG